MNVVDLDAVRRRRNEPSISDACILLEDFVASLDFTPEVSNHITTELGAILLAIADGNVDAMRSWRRIEREIRSPIRAREPGEHGCQPFIDRVVVVVALAALYRTTQQ
jgi:hypothetical protein